MPTIVTSLLSYLCTILPMPHSCEKPSYKGSSFDVQHILLEGRFFEAYAICLVCQTLCRQMLANVRHLYWGSSPCQETPLHSCIRGQYDPHWWWIFWGFYHSLYARGTSRAAARGHEAHSAKGHHPVERLPVLFAFEARTTLPEDGFFKGFFHSICAQDTFRAIAYGHEAYFAEGYRPAGWLSVFSALETGTTLTKNGFFKTFATLFFWYFARNCLWTQGTHHRLLSPCQVTPYIFCTWGRHDLY